MTIVTENGAQTKSRSSRNHRRGAARQVSAAHLGKLAAAREAVILPPITYPEDLPVSAHRREIADAIAHNQVVIVAGETGSGKTTQLPKILLELGRGRVGQIGHTQPRRIAARSVAERIAYELGTPLGEVVGYQVRFTDQSSERTLVKVMTDGILLASMQRDPKLLAYDTIIIDEAHERSLNIDFLLGYLARLLPTRPDLKLIITSATIDSERFAAHFSPANLARLGGAEPYIVKALPDKAPVVEVTGRTYPVEIRYAPLIADDIEVPMVSTGGSLRAPAQPTEPRASKPKKTSQSRKVDAERDLMTAIVDACQELMLEGPGDILVFLSGEREIKDAADTLTGAFKDQIENQHRPDAIEILPLYSRLSAAEQHRIFAPHSRRRIVLATNVAETSLTVPGIRYVVDTGLARISRYSKTTKVQRLPIEAISRASANQRSGRSGREAPGIAIRLYSESDFENRNEFTEPEILRTSLASVLLQMIAVGVVSDPDEVAAFPFVQAPDTRAVRDGVMLLRELGALDDNGLTRIGRLLAGLPIDPRLARMVIAGVELGVGAEVVVIAAALSIQDPRERPEEVREQADQLHARFVDPNSDFLTLLNLWYYLQTQQKELSGSAFRRLCKAEYIHYLRVREWQDLVNQIRSMAAEVGLKVGRLDESALGTILPNRNGDLIHRALLTGLLSQLGMQETKEIKASATAGLKGEARARALRQAAKRARNEYLGARGARFAIFPGSPVSKRPPAWLMAGELVETSRLWARQVARINPDWIESAAQHLVRRTYIHPHWSAKKGATMAVEKVSLYGLPIVADRKVLYSKLDPEAAREMFIRHALVNGEWQSPHEFLTENHETIKEIAKTAARSRRRELLIDDDDLYNFYDARLPKTIVSAAEFDKWYKAIRQHNPDILRLTQEALEHSDVDLTGFPDHWTQGEFTLPLSYEMAPGTDADGVTLHIPLEMLARVEDAGFDWLVPGMLDDLCVATIRSLPKAIRVQLVPAPDSGKQIAHWLRTNTPSWSDMTRAGSMAGSFASAFTEAARVLKGVVIPADAWGAAQQEKLPAHLRMRFSVEGTNPKLPATSLSLADLKKQFAPQVQASAQTALAQAYQIAQAGLAQAKAGGPETAIAALQKIVHPADVAATNATGVRAKLLAQNRLKTERITSRWSGKQALTLAASPYPTTAALVDDLQKAAVLALTDGTGGHPDATSISTTAELDTANAYVRQHLEHEVYQITGHVVAALTAYVALERLISANASRLPLLATLADVRAQSQALIHNGFIADTPPTRLPHLVRYLRAAIHRVEKAIANPSRDIALAQEVRQVEQLIETAKAQQIAPDKLVEARWLVEELRVSLYAQELGTQGKVSAKRIGKLLAGDS